MKGIITLLIFIYLFHGGVVGQQGAPKAIMKKKEEKVSTKKPSSKKDVAPQKKKENKPLVEKKNEVVAPVHEKEEMRPGTADSGVVSKETTAVVIAPHQHENTSKSALMPTPAAEPMSDWQYWTSWLSLGLIVGMGMYVFRTNGNIRDRLWKIQKHLDAQKANLQWEKAKYQAGINSAEVEHLINTSPTLKKIQEEYASLKSNMEKLQQPAPEVVPVIPAEEPPGATFYMTGPTNNYFPSSARSNNRENTVYKFILQPGGNEARFELHTTGASISEIIKVVESYIKPACDEENLPSSGTRNIVTRTPGRAILENEKWIIKDKAIIRYE
ncbi:hypothetical protein GO495_22645 [Chitinophaga oryziterrae]|uniref:Uncharacterized protein n=1 Tax=Chitinophaga oryziterrae TaxID=1031224 RepID=A0A6N8JDL0_9BACT|nr:hypothetical protein [Chitinophaga oryziterrae]MVT43415.1 hypothetical protein [Chitinophaga oryziterrae]